jgi:hypothetical protein
MYVIIVGKPALKSDIRWKKVTDTVLKIVYLKTAHVNKKLAHGVCFLSHSHVATTAIFNCNYEIGF